MTRFLNIDIDKSIDYKNLKIHLMFLFIWILGFSIFIYRIDLLLLNNLSNDLQWIKIIVPLTFIVCVILIMFYTKKWYYNLALISYPLLLIFWFIPKFILLNGKFYLIVDYLSFLFKSIKNYKRTISSTLILIIVIFLYSITDYNSIKISLLTVLSFFYFRYLVKYVKKSFQSNKDFDKYLAVQFDESVDMQELKLAIPTMIDEKIKFNDDTTEIEETKSKKLSRLILIKNVFEIISENLSNFKSRKAFVIYWIFGVIVFLFISISYFAFANFILYNVAPNQFSVIGEPKLFDFVYYALKTITFSGANNIVPISVLARIFEIVGFLILGLLLIVFIVSVFYTIKHDKINYNIDRVINICVFQKEGFNEYVKHNYDENTSNSVSQSEEFKKQLRIVRILIKSIF